MNRHPPRPPRPDPLFPYTTLFRSIQRRSARPSERPFARLSRGSSMPRLHRLAFALAASTALVAAGPALAKAKAGQAAPIAELVKAVDIPYQALDRKSTRLNSSH